MLKQLLITGDDPDLVALVRSVALGLGTAPRYAKHLDDALEGIGSTDLLVVDHKLDGGSGEQVLKGLLERGIELPPTLVFAARGGALRVKHWGTSVLRREPPTSEAEARLALQFLLRASGAPGARHEAGRNAQLNWVVATTDEQLYQALSTRASAEGITLLVARDRDALSAALGASEPGIVLLDLAGQPGAVRDFCGVCNRELSGEALVIELERGAGEREPLQLGPRHWLASRARAVEAGLWAVRSG